MMRHDRNGQDDQSQRHAIATLARRLQRSRVRVKARPARGSAANNMLTSFGMVVGLLMVWAVISGM